MKVRVKGFGIKGKGEKDLELKVRGNWPGIKGKEKRPEFEGKEKAQDLKVNISWHPKNSVNSLDILYNSLIKHKKSILAVV